MAHASFGSPGRVPVVTLVRADGLRLPVHRDLVGLTTLLLDLTEMMGYDVLPGQTWGYAPRYISGTTVWSNHAWATADDLNAPSNPYASADWHRRNARGTFPFGLRLVTNIPQKVIELWESHGYRWGGRYVSKPDPMHFEFMGTTVDAWATEARLRRFLTGAGSPPPPPPQPPSHPTQEVVNVLLPVLQRGSKGGAVKSLQALLNEKAGQGLTVDGDFGEATDRAVRNVERFCGIPVNGQVGSETWGVLFL